MGLYSRNLPGVRWKHLFCVDCRRLIAMMVRDSYRIPKMDELIDSMRSAVIFSTLNPSLGYRKIEIEEKVMKKSAFMTHNCLYNYMRMPFGQ